MPRDEWQMIIYLDTTEKTHFSYRYAQQKHTVSVSVCVCLLCLCVLQRCSFVPAIIGSCHVWIWWKHCCLYS